MVNTGVDVVRNRDFEGAPVAIFDTSPETLGKIKTWIDSRHPDNCMKLVDLLLSKSTGRHATATGLLVVHCIEEHDGGIELLARIHGSLIPLDEEKAGFSGCAKAKQAQLCDEILEKWSSIASLPGARYAVNLVTRHVDDAHFERIWTRVWKKGLASEAPELGGAVLTASAFCPPRSQFAIELVENSLSYVYKLVSNELVSCLVYSPHMTAVKDKVLRKLLSSYGHTAAELIILNSKYAKESPSCVVDATRLLMKREAGSQTSQIGVALSLNIDPDFAIPIVVSWVNDAKLGYSLDQLLEWRIHESNQKRLLGSMARDAIKKDSIWHVTLAQTHHHLITNIDAVLGWLKETCEDAGAARYNAHLIALYLSEPQESASLDKVRDLVEYARRIHRVFGSRNEEHIKRDWNLTDPSVKRYEELVAIALARDVTHPPDSIDSERTLRVIKKLPYTYRALGEKQLDKEMKKGLFLPFAEYYSIDAQSQLDRIGKRIGSPSPIAKMLLCFRKWWDRDAAIETTWKKEWLSGQQGQK